MKVLPPPRLLTDGLMMVESGRWHDGRLWLAHWGSGEVVAVDLDGDREVVGPGRDHMGWSIDWTPDGAMLVTGLHDVRRVAPDGSTSVVSEQGANEIVVDSAGRIYVDGFDGAFSGGHGMPDPGWIKLLDPAKGAVREVASDVAFPNGMVLTADGTTLVVAESMAGRLTAFDIADDGSLTGRRTWADGLGPDGIAIDAEDGVWAQTADTAAHTGDRDAPQGAVVRVRDGGEITHRVETEVPCFSCAVGGPDGRHLFLLCNEFEGVEAMPAVRARRSARVYVTEID